MAHSIKTVYVVHHSHTDIGYTDLQERVIAIQVNYIKTVLSMMRQPEYADFRWNCETLYCVEEFWKQASEDGRADFARFVKRFFQISDTVFTFYRPGFCPPKGCAKERYFQKSRYASSSSSSWMGVVSSGGAPNSTVAKASANTLSAPA